jgi:hypothetical protein
MLNFLVVHQNYYGQVKRSFEEALKVATDEGISDLNCAVFRLPFHLDYSKIIDFNRKHQMMKILFFMPGTFLADFYEFFKKVNPSQLKGIIREGTLPHFQTCVESLGLEGVVIDPRQISIDIIIDYIPSGIQYDNLRFLHFANNFAVRSNYLTGNHFYRSAIPNLNSNPLDGSIESSWEDGISVIDGQMAELSDPIYIK